jgi:16S rRNA (uracil1498-N3)-methyltransferase
VAYPFFSSLLEDAGNRRRVATLQIMSRRRFYSQPESINGSHVTLSLEESHHLTHVLRMRPGDEAFVFDGLGCEYRCSFESVRGDRALLTIQEPLTDSVESMLNLTLGQALAKGEKFDFIVQKATELGVRSIVPILADQGDVRLSEQLADKRLERWRRISLEALKQCGRRKLVELNNPRTVESLLEHDDSRRTRLVLAFSETGGEPVPEAACSAGGAQEVIALIGPEGGWSARELSVFERAGAKLVTLGRRVLRTETAAIAAITLVQHYLGDLSVRPVERTEV